MLLGFADLISNIMTLIAISEKMIVNSELINDGYVRFKLFAIMIIDIPVPLLQLFIYNQFVAD